MRIYLNNFSSQLTAALEQNKNQSILALGDKSTQELRNALPADGKHYIRLTLQNRDATEFELIDVVNFNGYLQIKRSGMEASTIKAWEQGTRITCAPTAGSFNKEKINTYTIDREASTNRLKMVLEIDYQNGRSQFLPDGDRLTAIVIRNMGDGDELLIEFEESAYWNGNPPDLIFQNADEVK